MVLPFKKIEEQMGDEVEIRWNENPLGYNNETKEFKYFNIEEQPYEGPIPDIDWADVVFTNNISNFGGPYTLEVLRQTRTRGKLAHWDTDDLLTDIYHGHRLKDTYVNNGLEEMAKHMYAIANLVSVTQERFAERIAPYALANDGKIVTIRNCLDLKDPNWNMPKAPAPKNLCRFGWVGGIHHDVDVKQIDGVFHTVNQKVGVERVFWGLYGRPNINTDDKDNQWQLDVWKGYEAYLARSIRSKRKNYNIYPALPTDRYGQFFTNIDVAIAPLEDNAFNDSKSSIKAIEAGAYKVPLVATNIGDYDTIIKHNHNGILIPRDNPKTAWIKQLSRLAKDKKMREELGQNLYDTIKDQFDLNKVACQRINVYKSMLGWEENEFTKDLRKTEDSDSNE